MKIVIIGAAGNLGARTTEQALDAGHDVIAYVRRPEAVAPRPRLTIVKGDAADVSTLADAARDADAMIVSITGSMKDSSFMQRTLPDVIEGARRAEVKHVILVSAFGAGDTADKASPLARLIYRTALRKFFADKSAADALLAASGLAYTIAYPVNLKDAPALSDATVTPLTDVRRVPGLPTLPFIDAARALVTIAANSAPSGERMLITTPRGWTEN